MNLKHRTTPYSLVRAWFPRPICLNADINSNVIHYNLLHGQRPAPLSSLFIEMNGEVPFRTNQRPVVTIKGGPHILPQAIGHIEKGRKGV